QVWAGGEALVAHAGDLLAGGHAVTDGDVDGGDVAVDGDVTIIVLDAHPVAEARSRTSIDDGAVLDCADRGANGVSDVRAVVVGAPASAETRGEGALGRLSGLRGAGFSIRSGALLRELQSGGELGGQVRGGLLQLRDLQDTRGVGLGAVPGLLGQERGVSRQLDGAISWGSGVCLLSASGGACGASRGDGTRCDGDQCEAALGAVIYLAVLANAPGAGGLLHVPCPFKLWRL